MSSKLIDCDIDLYADASEFNSNEEFNQDNNIDLYEDVVTTPLENHVNEDTPSRSGSVSPLHFVKNNRRFFAVYVGNLTWWTTDQNIMDALGMLGVNDVVEVKFFENRANGQSKGYCVIALGSEKSVKITLDKFGEKEIHGQIPQVLTYTKQNLSYFENQSRKSGRRDQDNINERRSRDREIYDRSRHMPNERSKGRNDHSQAFSLQHRTSHIPQLLPRGPPPRYLPGHSQWISNSPMALAQSAHLGLPPNVVPSIQTPFQHLPPPSNVITPHNLRMPPPNSIRGPVPAIAPRQFPPSNLHGPSPHEWEYPNTSQPLLTAPSTGHPPPYQNPNQPASLSSHLSHSMYFHSQRVVSNYVSAAQSSESFDQPSSSELTNYRSSYKQEPSAIDSEFEEIMNRNKIVSSSAITRAVSDASAGDYASAIETLVTAISLIKQSKIADDERCKILVTSLQDTLHGVEMKSYGHRSKERSHSKERERSHERSLRRDKGSRRDRSRSRDKDYVGRSREKERHHEDRYRDRDRDYDHRSVRH